MNYGDSSRLQLQRILSFSFLLLTAHCLLLTVTAQTPQPVDVISIDTDLVNLNVSVLNQKVSGQILPLQESDFAVYEDGVRQQISFFASAASPFDLVLLLDLSGSTADKIGLVKKSAKRLIDATRPSDRIAIVTFTAEI